MCARLPIGAVWGHPRLGEVLLCWMHVPSLVLCYEIRSIPFSILTFSRVRGHLAKKPLLVMGEGQGEWVFFFSPCAIRIGPPGSSCWVGGLGTAPGAAVVGEGTDSVMSTPPERPRGQMNSGALVSLWKGVFIPGFVLGERWR